VDHARGPVLAQQPVNPFSISISFKYPLKFMQTLKIDIKSHKHPKIAKSNLV
jgi:hypothetical protein